MAGYEQCHPPVVQRPKPFRMEAVIVCADYDDFLRHTLPYNKHIFDRLVIVTTPEDKATRKLCEFYHVECVPTNVLMPVTKQFCKGAGINKGLEKLDLSDWVIHLDADIWLPPQTRRLLERADLDKSMIYGVDRFNVRGCTTWNKFLDAPILQHENDTYIHLHAFPLGTRVMISGRNGYAPIGFFQMWNPGVSGVTRYPEGHTDAGREDLMLTYNWPRSKRGFIPEVIAYHLESEDAGMESNWRGRTTSRFELAAPPVRSVFKRIVDWLLGRNAQAAYH